MILNRVLIKILYYWPETKSQSPNGILQIKFNTLCQRQITAIIDDLLEEFATLFTQLLKDMPENSELGEMKITVALNL